MKLKSRARRYSLEITDFNHNSYIISLYEKEEICGFIELKEKVDINTIDAFTSSFKDFSDLINYLISSNDKLKNKGVENFQSAQIIYYHDHIKKNLNVIYSSNNILNYLSNNCSYDQGIKINMREDEVSNIYGELINIFFNYKLKDQGIIDKLLSSSLIDKYFKDLLRDYLDIQERKDYNSSDDLYQEKLVKYKIKLYLQKYKTLRGLILLLNIKNYDVPRKYCDSDAQSWYKNIEIEEDNMRSFSNYDEPDRYSNMKADGGYLSAFYDNFERDAFALDDESYDQIITPKRRSTKRYNKQEIENQTSLYDIIYGEDKNINVYKKK